MLLIADDSPHKIDLIRMMLHKAHWTEEPLIAHTTEEAFALIEQNEIGYAFVDYYIPTKNGPAVIAKLKENNPAAHIALVSSSDKKSNFDEAKEAGAEACICTTYQSDEVEGAFMELLQKWQGMSS